MIVSHARRQTLGDLLRRTARRVPQRMALLCGETQWSYAELDAVVDNLCAALPGIGIEAGDKVAILARNSHAFIAMRFALARAGAVLVPINFMLNADEVAFILRHSGARVLCTDTGLSELARAAAARDTGVETLVWLPGEVPAEPCADMLSYHDLLRAGQGMPLPQPDLHGGMLAQILYTSGTESLPKGAMLAHDSVIAQYISVMTAAEYRSHRGEAGHGAGCIRGGRALPGPSGAFQVSQARAVCRHAAAQSQRQDTEARSA